MYVENLTLREAAKLFPPIEGTYPRPDTLRRWIVKGINGHKLEATRVGRRIVVTKDACEAFHKAINNGHAGNGNGNGA